MIYDPIADQEARSTNMAITIDAELPERQVPGHRACREACADHRPWAARGSISLLAPGGLIYDVTGVLPPGESDACI